MEYDDGMIREQHVVSNKNNLYKSLFCTIFPTKF